MKRLFSFKYLLHFPILLIVGFQIGRLMILPFLGLMPQDAYYFYYGQNLDWSYFDHPGMIGYVLRLFSELFGHSVWVVKFADFTLSSLSLWGLWVLGNSFLPISKNRIALFVFASSVLLSMLSLNSTPDVPLLLFWILSLISLQAAIFKKQKFHWILSGILMGFAFNSKYTAILLPFGLFAFLVFSRNYRSYLKTIWPWISMLFFALVSYPVYYWNKLHLFASFGFQTTERSSSMGLSLQSPKLFIGFLSSQMILVYPIVFIVLTIIAYKYSKKVIVKRKIPSDKTLFLLAFFIPTFIGFFLLSPLYWIKINWLIPSYVTGFILVAMVYKKRWFPVHLITAVLLHIFISIEVFTYVFPIKSDDTFWGWEPLSDSIKTLSAQHPEAFIFSSDGYKTSAVIQFYIPDHTIYGPNVVGDQGLQFSIEHPNLTSLKSKNALFIDSDPQLKTEKTPYRVPEKLLKYFDSVQQLPAIELKSNSGKLLRKFNVLKCYGYRP